jgi:hypothetical protein
VIGASESSTTSATDLVPAGAPAQVSGGVAVRLTAQVNRSGKAPCVNAPSDTVITLGAVTVTPEEKSPHPASGTANAAAAPARAIRLAGPRRRCLESARHVTRPILGPVGRPVGAERRTRPIRGVFLIRNGFTVTPHGPFPRGTGSLPAVLEQEKDAQAYAWNWFALHAGQRLQLVNFWLVAVAFLAGAYVQAKSSHLYAVALGVSVTGAVASIAFSRLDARTRQLVQVAEAALGRLEDQWVAGGADERVRLVGASHHARRSPLDSYRIIIQGLQLLTAVMFVLAAVYA